MLRDDRRHACPEISRGVSGVLLGRHVGRWCDRRLLLWKGFQIVTYIVKEGESIRYVTQGFSSLCDWIGNRKDCTIETWCGSKLVRTDCSPVWQDYHLKMMVSEAKSRLGFGLEAIRLHPTRIMFTKPEELP